MEPTLKLPQSNEDRLLFDEVMTTNIIPLLVNGTFAELPGLAGHKFDIIHSAGLVGANPDQSFFHPRNDIGGENLESMLINQASTLLADNGVMYLGRNILKK